MVIFPPPVNDAITQNDKLTRNWLSWFNSLFSNSNQNISANSYFILNPDFNWSRTKGNTPTIADGEFVEKWNVKANGMTFSITPTYYTSTTNSSFTGSERYVNVAISSVNSNDFVIYQTVPKILSLLQNKKATLSASIYNHNTITVIAKFYIGFDLTGGGTDSYSIESGIVELKSGINDIFATVSCPKISVDNQTNIITIAVKLVQLGSAVNLDMFFIKPEVGEEKTMFHVEHTLEKLKIDNL
jgi:hypothetical protein